MQHKSMLNIYVKSTYYEKHYMSSPKLSLLNSPYPKHTHTHKSALRHYHRKKPYGISRLTRVGRFAPWILLHKPLSFAPLEDRTHILISSFNEFIHIFLGLPLDLLPTTFIYPKNLKICPQLHKNSNFNKNLSYLNYQIAETWRKGFECGMPDMGTCKKMGTGYYPRILLKLHSNHGILAANYGL
jgi:hypothetical protein